MTETIGNAVAKVDQTEAITGWVVRSTDDFGQVLPTHLGSAHWVRLACGLLRRNQDLAKAAIRNPESFKAALLDCARLGHEPGTEAYAFAVFGGEVVGIEQYQGAIERMYRAGGVQSVICEVVREKDYFNWQPGRTPDHDADWFATAEVRGPLVGVYAYANLTGGGTSKVVVMGAEEVGRHRDVAKTQNIWKTWPEAMWRKTAIHELEKWVPSSAEYRREHLRAIAASEQVRPTPAPETPAIEADTTTHHTTEE